MLNGLGGHVGAAEGAVAVGDDLDVDGAAVSVLWASTKARFRVLPLLCPPAPSAGRGPSCSPTPRHTHRPSPCQARAKGHTGVQETKS